MAKINLNCSACGIHNFKVFKNRGEYERYRAWQNRGYKKAEARVHPRLELDFFNLILNSGLELIATGSSVQSTMSRCSVGTGTSEPDAQQTWLQDAVGTSIGGGSISDNINSSSPYYMESTREYVFNTAEVYGIDGVSLAEVLIHSTTTGGAFSRSLIRDSEGVPTTITLLPEEVLVVTYTVRRYFMEDDVSGTFTLHTETGPVTYDYVLRACNVTSNTSGGWLRNYIPSASSGNVIAYETQTLGSLTSSGPSGNSDSSDSVTQLPYVSESYTATFSAFFGISDGNFSTGIGSFTFGSAGSSGARMWQISVSRQSDGEKIIKTNEETLALDEFLSVTYSHYSEE